MLKGIRLNVRKIFKFWWQDLTIGGNNLTNINFAMLGNQVKFVHTLNYYQQSSGKQSDPGHFLKVSK